MKIVSYYNTNEVQFSLSSALGINSHFSKDTLTRPFVFRGGKSLLDIIQTVGGFLRHRFKWALNQAIDMTKISIKE